jgi:hypothetical protein
MIRFSRSLRIPTRPFYIWELNKSNEPLIEHFADSIGGAGTNRNVALKM